MYFQHHRFQIWNQSQHPYKHKLNEFAYTSDALPGVTNVESALNYILAVLYPQTQEAVADVASLPSSGNTINDFRVVNDDGDGKAAAYRWEQREGDVAAKWYKIYDMDWGADSILEQFLTRTQDLYVFSRGNDDLDYTGTAVTGLYAGQRIFGGKSANTNLTLSANSGDLESNTGYVQITDEVRPTVHNTLSLGQSSYKWHKIWAVSANVDTLTITTGSIVDSTGAISFDNENLSTTGTFTAGQVSADNLRLDGNTLSSLDTNGDINIVPDGTGIVNLSSAALSTTGAITGGQLNADNIRIDGNTISSTNTNGDINVTPNGDGGVYLAGGILQTSATAFTAHSHQTHYHVDKNYGDLSGATDYTAAVYRAYAAPVTGAFTGHVDGIHVQTNLGGNQTVAEIRAVNGMARYSGSNTAALVVGGYFESQNTATGTITTAASVYAATPTNTGGGTITNSYALYADGNAAVVGTLTVTGEAKVDNLSLNGNTLSSLDTNGNVIIDPNGTGLIEAGAGVFPTTDDSFDVGKTGNRFSYVWLSGGVKDGTNTFTVADLMTLRSVTYRDSARTSPAQSGDSLFFDGTQWLASAPDTEIDHGSVSGLSDDDHAQYALLAGRASGQSLTGGTEASESLTLESTSHGTKGSILFSSKAAPTTDAAYSGGWQGTDLGGSSNYWRDVYTKGQHYGFRLENVAAVPSASANNIGRMVYDTVLKDIYLDEGGTWYRLGVNRYVTDTSWNGSDTSKTVTVSGDINDARNAIWQLCDNTNDYERIFCSIKAISTTQVTITVGTPLASGSYRLIGIE